MKTFRSVIDLWPTYAALAEKLEVSPAAVKQMRRRSSIPAAYWNKLVRGAHEEGISGLSTDVLANLAERRGTGK